MFVSPQQVALVVVDRDDRAERQSRRLKVRPQLIAVAYFRYNGCLLASLRD